MPISLPTTRKLAVTAAAVAGALLTPSAANAVVTLGPPMSSYDADAPCNADTCAVVHQSLPSLTEGAAPFKVTLPENVARGVIVRYRMSGSGKFGGLFTGRYTDEPKDVFVRSQATPEVPFWNHPEAEPPWIELKEGKPIANGEYIGLLMRKGAVLMLNNAPGVVTDFWQPAPAIGVPSQPGVKGTGVWRLNQPTRAAFQAQVELDGDGDGLGDESQDPTPPAAPGQPPQPTVPPAKDKVPPKLSGMKMVGRELRMEINEGGVVKLAVAPRKASNKRCGTIRKPYRTYTRTRSSKGVVKFVLGVGTFCVHVTATDLAGNATATRDFWTTIKGARK